MAKLGQHVDSEEAARGNNEPLSIRLAGEFHIVLAEMTGSVLLTRYVSEVCSRSGLILAIYGRPHSSECAVSEHRAVIQALTAGDAAAAIEVMDHHLAAVADRALIQTTTQKRRDLRDVLDAYVPAAITGRLADAGVAITVLPSTDLFLMGRVADHNAPRGVTRADRFHAHGVTCSLATNNVLNPFTPFGDASLIRMANLYANIAQLGRAQDLDTCLDMVTVSAARLLNLRDYGVAVGNAADLIVVPGVRGGDAVAEIARPLLGLKRGQRTFVNAPGRLLPPAP